MKKVIQIIIIILFQFLFNLSYSQYKVTFIVKQPSVLHSSDHFFIAGNFNEWDPGNKNYELKKTNSGIDSITISFRPGSYEYKITRGTWEKTETLNDGKGISNHILLVSNDTIINIEIKGWSDDFATSHLPKIHTLSANVKIMDTAFYMPQLHRYRRIWIYLPPDYSATKKHFPVLYMHDGQNLFDDVTSYAGEWGVDEFLDSIAKQHQKEVIVVGIDNGLAKRMNEYNPYSFQQYGNGEGDAYVDFLVKTLKPFIDAHYKTMRDKKNTFIAGSSMGGLISLYAVLKYPNIYGGAGIFSPAFWTARGLDSIVIQKSKRINLRLFFYAGGKEGDSMVPDMKRIEKEIASSSKAPIKEMIDVNAKHNEAAWRKYFPDFYRWTIMDKN